MNGVLDMAFLSIIRRWHKRDHVPIREISRHTGVSRNTVRKYLRSDVIEPKFQVPDRPSKHSPFGMTKRLVEHHPKREVSLDCERRIDRLSAQLPGSRGMPARHGFLFLRHHSLGSVLAVQ